MIHSFIILQAVLFFFMALHDWVDIPPFTDLSALRKAHPLRFRLLGSCVNGGLVLLPFIVTLLYISSPMPVWARLLVTGIYGLLTMGTITAWWIPYFGGGYWVHGNKAGFEEYRNTHSFLPVRGSNVVPNTLHVILHLQIWICFGLSIYWLFL
jgi:hypothetical protein